MPNWCENELSIRGPKKDVQQLLAHVDGGEENRFDFNSLIPYPKVYADKDAWAELEQARIHSLPEAERQGIPWPEDGYNHGGYDWCHDNWGTKWPASKIVLDFEPDDYDDDTPFCHAEFRFETAWSPPVPVIENLAVRFPMVKVQLRFYERGAEFQGWLTFDKGRLVENIQGTYLGQRGG